ncbi:MAG: glycosyltransferase family 4 protein [Candidatus Scalindua sp. AMX11]|nr:MAG: glycosyltransferase family 4 protein [Candidatus Scalindua sp.]NOG84100.1 glycosyltransferase [Planctomycetota bacterium]RZV99007.1 MAG: glycosyltransferase family 4 protein [Candidatus Scalindua sp. SCAELEC01]TDE66978.1 MAG: glycosyltransferase family 4 protein [Candidatus Scalindua sp. AMX11]
MRGGEKVLEVFCELFPDAHVYTLLHVKGSVSETIEDMDIRTSFVQKLPMARSKYRRYLPLFPVAIEKFDLGGYDLVLSSSHCVAKGVITGADTLHICYCFTPMRYIWDLYDLYFGKGRSNFITRGCMSLLVGYLRRWDVTSSKRVDKFISISRYITDRIEKYYNREPDIIYPPVDCDYFTTASSDGDYYLMVSPLAPNKRVDIAIGAFNKLNMPLKIIGSGQETKRLQKLAGKSIELMGWQSDEVVREHYANCKALIFPGVEDFGIVPLEAQACGKPVIAYGFGGVLDTILPLEDSEGGAKSANTAGNSATGIFFYQQDSESLLRAVLRFEDNREAFHKERIREHAISFDRSIFKDKIKDYVEKKYSEFRDQRVNGVN